MQIRTFLAPDGAPLPYASGRAIIVGTAVLIVSLELWLNGAVGCRKWAKGAKRGRLRLCAVGQLGLWLVLEGVHLLELLDYPDERTRTPGERGTAAVGPGKRGIVPPGRRYPAG
jgi:hypothetical protein